MIALSELLSQSFGYPYERSIVLWFDGETGAEARRLNLPNMGILSAKVSQNGDDVYLVTEDRQESALDGENLAIKTARMRHAIYVVV